MQIKSQTKFSKQHIASIFQQTRSPLLQKPQFVQVLQEFKDILSLRTIQKLCRPITQQARDQLMAALNEQLKKLDKKLQKLRSIRNSRNNKKQSGQVDDGSKNSIKTEKKAFQKAINFIYIKGNYLYYTINQKMKIITNAFDIQRLHKIDWEQWKQTCLNNNKIADCGCFG